MTNITKKIVAIVSTISIAVWALPVGALTSAELQAMIDSLMTQIVALQGQLSQSQGGTPATAACLGITFSRNLSQGMSGTDVKCLQSILNQAADTRVSASGVGSAGAESNYFGALTKAAVVNFQEKYASEVLAPLGLTNGTGFVGAKSIVKLNTMVGTTGGTGGTVIPPVSTSATVSLAIDTPEARQIALGASDVVITKIKFTGGTSAYTVSKILVKRSGVAADADVAAIKLYDGTTQIGSSQALNTNTHKATFSTLNWTIPAGTTKYLTVKVSIAAKGTATVGDGIKLGIDAVSDITSTATLSGTFPIEGKALTIAGISVGELFVAKQASPATSTNMLSGSTEQEIAAWQFTASSSEAVSLQKVVVTHVGSANGTDLSNVKLKYAGAQIGNTVASLDSQNQATFDLSGAPLEILSGASKTVYAYADIASGISTARTIIFEITQYTDLVAYGTNSGGIIDAAYTDTVAFSKQTGNTMTIGQGTLTVNVDAALNPASQNYVKGTSNRLMSAFKFTTGSVEGARITKLKLKLNNGSGTATDVSNITLWDGSTMIAGPVSLIGTYATFGSNSIGWDTTGLFDVAKSSNRTIQVKADIPSGADSTTPHTLDMDIAAATDIWADGLSSMYDVPQASITLTSGAGNSHTITASGALALSLSSNTPPAQTYIKGSTGLEMMRFNLTADSGEDVSVSSVTVALQTAANADTAAGDFTNVKLMKLDGTQIGSTASSPTASASFSFNLTVPASETVTLKVMADIPTTSALATAGGYFKITAAADMTSEGVSSSATITETGFAVTGKTMAVGQGSLTISAAATPGDQTTIIGVTEIPVVALVMTAGSAEDVRLTRIKLTGVSTDSVDADQSNLSNVALWEGSTRLTAKKGWDSSTATTVTFSASDFLNSSGITIIKGAQKTITVKADIPSTAVNATVIGLGISTGTDNVAFTESTTSDVTIVGLSSNTNPDPILSFSATLNGVNYKEGSVGHADAKYVTLAAKGTVTIVASADIPDVNIITVGAYGVGRADAVFLKVDLTASREDIDIKSVEIERPSFGADVDFANVSLWDGTTQIGVDQTLANTGIANSSTTFTLPVGSYWRLPAGVTKTLTVKADLNGVKSADQVGVTTGSTPKLCLATGENGNYKVNNLGVSSGARINASSTADLCSNEQILHQSKPTLSAASLPTTVLGNGDQTLYRWTVTADSKGAIGWKKVVFDMSGSVTVNSVGYTIGAGPTTAITTGTSTDGVYMGTSTSAHTGTATQLIATSSMHVYNVATGDEVLPTTTDTGFFVWNYLGGGARIGFTAKNEQIVAAGETKTYELRGNIAQSGVAGNSISTKIAKRSTATSTASFENVVDADFDYGQNTATVTSTAPTFIWSDRSGAGATHTMGTADWSQEYKVPGVPTATLSLSK